MYRSISLAALLVLMLAYGSYATAQMETPASESWSPIGTGADEPAEEKEGGWFSNGVTWPQWKMPEMKLPTLTQNKETGEPGIFTESFQKVQSASRTAATKTRDAWNGTVDKFRMSLPGGKDDTAVAKGEPKQHFWSDWFGEEKDAGVTAGGSTQIARDPTSKTR